MNTATDVQGARTGGLDQDPRNLFISYSHADKEWVHDFLVPRLEAVGLTIFVDDRDFDVGMTLCASIQKGIQRCRHLLAVVTPDWIESDWTEYESVLANVKDPSGENRGIVPLMVRPCTIPDRIKNRLVLDLTNVDDRGTQMAKLFRQLGIQDDAIERAQALQMPLIILFELMDEPGVKKEVSKFCGDFREAQRAFKCIANNKTLHDNLQNAEQKVDDLVRPARRLASGKGDWNDLRSRVGYLRIDLETLLLLTSPDEGNSLDTPWVDTLKGSLDAMREAISHRDEMNFQLSFELISGVVKRTLPAVNDEIVREFRKMPVKKLEVSLKIIEERLARFKFNDAARELLDSFQKHIVPLVDLNQTAENLVVNHNTLQQIDLILGLGSQDENISVEKIRSRWKSLTPHVEKLRFVQSSWRPAYDDVNNLLNDPTAIQDDKYESQLQEFFNAFVLEMKLQFNHLDVVLDKTCQKLGKLGDQLECVISRMNKNDSIRH